MENRQIWLNDIEPVEALSFEKIENSYMKVIMARLVIVYFVLMGCALFILMLDTPYDTALLVATECLLATAFAVNAVLVRKIYDFKGFALRNKDISYRSGIFFESVTTIPFSKIQQVSTRMNLVSRFFSLYYVDVINGSQDVMSRLTIPGLSAEKAEQLKSLLINNTRCGNE